jgi:prophage maintenance system killer protein
VSGEYGGNQAAPGVVISQYGLLSTVQRPQATIFGKDAYPAFSDKAAAFIFALTQNMPFKNGNRRLALAALLAFCEINGKSIDTRHLDEKGLENLIKRAAGFREHSLAPEDVFAELRAQLSRAIA